MDNYVTLGAHDAAESEAFYDAVMATIGWSCHRTWPGWRGYSRGGTGTGLTVWTCAPFDGAPASAGNGTMVALAVDSRDKVDAVYKKAIELGSRDEGQAGPRGEHFYAGYFRDPDGNKLAVFKAG